MEERDQMQYRFGLADRFRRGCAHCVVILLVRPRYDDGPGYPLPGVFTSYLVPSLLLGAKSGCV